MTAANPSSGTDQANDAAADERVHHHARIGGEHPRYPDGSFLTLCGIRVKARPEAFELPCCSMCALEMGRPCR